ncbi:hypothetical protein LJC68_07370 [Bacteroidales bacterium OttesenSCG-928-B11]|nr:hypothetical protein [Bacteroidales bacterium OttesenSCG-928-B11]MDL2326889.1 hypothetical protein [Bacteroidales bacterium OttesenSCG-928-A14]
MKKLFKYLFATILFIGCSHGETIRFFEEYDFNSGNYKLYGILSEGGETCFTENVGDFVVLDTVTLNKIKQDWEIHHTNKRMPCGYSYLMILMEGDSCVYDFGVNLDCKYLTCDKGWFQFSPKLLNKYKKMVLRISREEAKALQDTLISKHVFD